MRACFAWFMNGSVSVSKPHIGGCNVDWLRHNLIRQQLCMGAIQHTSDCAHTWLNEWLSWHWLEGYPQCTMGKHQASETTTEPWTMSQDNVRETRGRNQSTALSVPSFLSFVLRCGCALHRTANKIRLRGGPHPAGSLYVCVCVWNRLGYWK